MLLATVLGSAVALLDTPVVNVSLSASGADLGAGFGGLQWTVNGPTLTLAAFFLLGGSLGDRYERRQVFVVDAVCFGVASVLCGLAPNIEQLGGAPPRLARRVNLCLFPGSGLEQGARVGLLTSGAVAAAPVAVAEAVEPSAVGRRALVPGRRHDVGSCRADRYAAAGRHGPGCRWRQAGDPRQLLPLVDAG